MKRISDLVKKSEKVNSSFLFIKFCFLWTLYLVLPKNKLDVMEIHGIILLLMVFVFWYFYAKFLLLSFLYSKDKDLKETNYWTILILIISVTILAIGYLVRSQIEYTFYQDVKDFLWSVSIISIPLSLFVGTIIACLEYFNFFKE